jgi:hypothetical protein
MLLILEIPSRESSNKSSFKQQIPYFKNVIGTTSLLIS